MVKKNVIASLPAEARLLLFCMLPRSRPSCSLNTLVSKLLKVAAANAIKFVSCKRSKSSLSMMKLMIVLLHWCSHAHCRGPHVYKPLLPSSPHTSLIVGGSLVVLLPNSYLGSLHVMLGIFSTLIVMNTSNRLGGPPSVGKNDSRSV